jgi:hypothetical protein
VPKAHRLGLTTQVDKTGKGVSCRTEKRENMPKDERGNIVDVLIYGNSTFNRMNMGRFYEQFFNAAGRDITQNLREELGLDRHERPTLSTIENSPGFTPEFVEWAFAKCLRFYQILSPGQYKLMLKHPNPTEHVTSIIRDGVYLWLPTNNPVNYRKAAVEIRDGEFCPFKGPVTYRDPEGKWTTTEKEVLIGGIHLMMLEKTGEEWSAAASVKVQHFGVPAKLNQHDRNTSPGRQQAVRGLGESETRSYVCTVGSMETMEFLDASNNPDSHRRATRSIIEADQPTNIPEAIPRDEIPYGGSRPVTMVQHVMECRGIRFVYQKESEE